MNLALPLLLACALMPAGPAEACRTDQTPLLHDLTEPWIEGTIAAEAEIVGKDRNGFGMEARILAMRRGSYAGTRMRIEPTIVTSCMAFPAVRARGIVVGRVRSTSPEALVIDPIPAPSQRDRRATAAPTAVTATLGKTAVGERQPLDQAEIRQAFTGNSASYSPPGWFDVAIHEAFYEDGTWAGQHNGRGPVSFSGRWTITNNQLCVVAADTDSIRAVGHMQEHCRTVWRDSATKQLWMDYLRDEGSLSSDFGPRTLIVRPLLLPR